MIAPGSKGWIAKYLTLVEKGEIVTQIERPAALTNEQFNHHFLAQSGIVYGYPSRLILGTSFNQSKWTQDEKLTVLLFESLLFTYCNFNKTKQFDSNHFLDTLYVFYKNHRVQSLGSFLGYLFKEAKSEKLERILAKRTDAQVQLSNTKSWAGLFNNAFIYLDILLFEEFLKSDKSTVDYQSLAVLSLSIISLSAYSDGKIEDSEKALFDAFLVSADLDHDERELAKLRFKNGTSLNELDAELIASWNFKRYLLDLSSLTIYANHDAHSEEKDFLEELRSWLHLAPEDLNQAVIMAQQFVLENHKQVGYLKDANTVELMVTNVSKRWIKILGRNKDKLAVELKQSKELVALIRKSTAEELTKEEKEKVKTQFLDIAKSMPALAIFLLPGGALLLPIVLKIIPTLIPSAFRDNEVEK
ncbi:MAG: LETM1-related biofilm-associated protein [Moraxellaceae bacterium]